jgi:hypothetical protein
LLFLPGRPAGIIDAITLPPAGLEWSILPSFGFAIGAAARDPLFIFTPPSLKLRRKYRLVVELYLDVDQQQGPDQLVLVEVAARQERGPHLLLESVAPYLVP